LLLLLVTDAKSGAEDLLWIERKAASPLQSGYALCLKRREAAHAPVDMDKLDWKRWLGPAADQPFRPERFYQWRHYWDFGGGCLTDLMTHWIDVVHWYMDVDAPLAAAATSHNYRSSNLSGRAN
jgi:hypothetical protein